MKKVLFIVKCRGIAYEQTDNTVLVPYDQSKSYCLSSGLFNSAKFMADMLAEQCIESKLVQVVDNNCLHKNSMIITEDGEMTIKEIVDEKYSGKVLSFNVDSNKHEWKNVTKHWVKPFEGSGKEFVRLIPTDNKKFPITTQDHKFAYVDDIFNPKINYIEAKDMIGKHAIYYSDKKSHTANLYNKEQISTLIGSLLGDGCISDRHVFSYGHSIKQKEYADFKFNILGNDGCISKENVNNSWGSSTYNYTTKVTAQTKLISKLIRRENGYKAVENIIHLLDDIGLAFWYMDDGVLADCSYKQSRPNARLCTHGYTEEQNILLANILSEKFGITPKIRQQKQNSKIYYFLEFLKDDSEKLFNIISKYVHASMDYKLPIEFRTSEEEKYIFNTERLDCAATFIEDITNSFPKGASALSKSDLYDIQVDDNHNFFANGVNVHNCIDKEVTKFRPTHVIIEALWVVPEKFEVLKRLHPDVKWIIRLHSETPFISGEGNAMDWIFRYLKYSKVYIAPNTERMYNDLKNLTETKYNSWIAKKRIIYLPNFYKSDFKYGYNPKKTLDIGCFGSLRPLKNQLIQAMAAVEYAKQTKQRLRYHINSGRVEHGNNALKNIRALFEHLDSTRFELVEHDWLTHDRFLELVRKMDICLQVSYSETFNIVTGDAVSQGIPVVTSKEIFWVSSLFHADPNSINDIVVKMKRAIFFKKIGAWVNVNKLKCYNRHSVKTWLKTLKRI